MRVKNPIRKCQHCGYKSTRAFNIFRHQERIHDKAKKDLECCGLFYYSKGDYYCHVEQMHPHTRNGTVSKRKYKMTKKFLKRKNVKKIKKDEIVFIWDENISWPTGKQISEFLRNIKFHKFYE